MSSSAALLLLLVWIIGVGSIVYLATGFGGGLEAAFRSDPAASLVALLSPLLPAAAWVEARRRERKP